MSRVTEDLIDQVYEAAAVPGLWDRVLDRVARQFGSIGGLLFTHNSQCNGWAGSSIMRSLYAEFVERGLEPYNPRTERAFARTHCGFIADHELFTPDEMDRDPFYQYLRSKGGGWCVCTVIRAPSEDLVVFSWERRFEEGPFSAEAVAALDPLRAHLARAALISGRLGLERARAATEVLGLIGLPAAVLSRSHRLLAANKLLDDLVPQVIQDRRVRIGLVDKRADSLLGLALRHVAGQSADQVRSIPIAATEDAPASVVHIVPVRGAANDIFGTASCVLVLTTVSQQAIAATQVIQGLFDLTPAEAHVAHGIAAGKTVDAIAMEVGVAVGTVRQQLKAVFGKTGVSRQAELVGMLVGSALRSSGPSCAP
ncbi:DNA-binding CsgD family transcriptional regulator [Bradyrhizobium sp. USDA 4501]